MEHKEAALPVLGLIVLLSCIGFASAQTSPVQPQPLETLDVSQFLREESAKLTLTTAAFSSEDSIAVETYQEAVQGPQFAQYVVQWRSGSFNRVAQTPGLRWGGRSSADGSRKLLEISQRKVPRLQHLLEVLHTITTLGMSGPEDVNYEAVRVIDSATGKSCFDWRRSFPMDWSRGRFATISPSGELVAIAVDNDLSIYRLPVVCQGPTKMRK